MLRRILLSLAAVAATTGVFAEDGFLPEAPCLTEANGRQLLLLEYPEVELIEQTESTRVYVAKRNGRLYPIALDACTTATLSIQRVLPKR